MERKKYDYRGMSLSRNSYTLDEVGYLKHHLKIYLNRGSMLTYLRILTCLRGLGIDYNETEDKFTKVDGTISGFNWECFV